ncbi:hypothetical protein GCM10010234_00950 [Streptomyces hawaiiensis]
MLPVRDHAVAPRGKPGCLICHWSATIVRCLLPSYPRFGYDEREFAERLVRAVAPTFEVGGA